MPIEELKKEAEKIIVRYFDPAKIRKCNDSQALAEDFVSGGLQIMNIIEKAYLVGKKEAIEKLLKRLKSGLKRKNI